MIIVLKPGVTRDQVEDFSNHLAKTNSVTVNAWYGEHSTVLGLLGDTAAVDMDSIAAQDIVQSVRRVQEPYKKATRTTPSSISGADRLSAAASWVSLPAPAPWNARSR